MTSGEDLGLYIPASIPKMRNRKSSSISAGSDGTLNYSLLSEAFEDGSKEYNGSGQLVNKKKDSFSKQ